MKFKSMKLYFDTEFRPFSEIANEFPCDVSMHEYFIDSFHKLKYKKSADGYIIACCLYNWWRIMIVGEIDKNDLLIDGACVYYKPTKEDWKTFEDVGAMDFILNWSDKKIHKFYQKHSINKYEGKIRTETENVNISMEQWNNLFDKWKEQTRTERTSHKRSSLEQQNNMPTKINHSEFLNSDLFKIAYYLDDKLVCLQMFRVFGENVYWLLNISDYDFIKDLHKVYPMKFFNKPIHFLGAGPNDRRLIEHKAKLTDDYVTHKTLTIRSTNTLNIDIFSDDSKIKENYLLNSFDKICKFYNI